MTYFIIRDTLIMIFYFIIYTKFLNKMNGQIRRLKVKNDTLFGTDGVDVCNRVSMLNLMRHTSKKKINSRNTHNNKKMFFNLVDYNHHH